MSNFTQGMYLVWDITGEVEVKFTALNGNAVLSGLFFGPGTSSAVFIGEDSATRGNWSERYGTRGYVLAGEATIAGVCRIGPIDGGLGGGLMRKPQQILEHCGYQA